MAKFTFLELHFDDANLTANAPFSHGEKDVEASEEPPEDDEPGSRKGAIFALLVGLLFSIAVAYLVRKKVFADGSGDEDELSFDSEN